MTKARTQIQLADAAEPERLVRVLNAAFMEACTRLEAVESVKGVTVLPEVSFDYGAASSPTTAPFSGGGVRISCPFTPTGLVLLRAERVKPEGQPVSTTTCDVKWHFAAGPQQGDGAVILDFITGLSTGSWRVRVGVTRD